MGGSIVSEEWYNRVKLRKGLVIRFYKGLYETLEATSEYRQFGAPDNFVHGKGKLSRQVPPLEIADIESLKRAVILTKLSPFPQLDHGRSASFIGYRCTPYPRTTSYEPRFFGDPVWIDFLNDQFGPRSSIFHPLLPYLRVFINGTVICIIEFEMHLHSKDWYIDMVRAAYLLSNIHLLPSGYFSGDSARAIKPHEADEDVIETILRSGSWLERLAMERIKNQKYKYASV
jgi:hypothetical protein